MSLFKQTLMGHAPLSVSKQWSDQGNRCRANNWSLGPEETVEFLQGKGVREIANEWLPAISGNLESFDAAARVHVERPSIVSAVLDMNLPPSLETCELMCQHLSAKMAARVHLMADERYGLDSVGFFAKDRLPPADERPNDEFLPHQFVHAILQEVRLNGLEETIRKAVHVHGFNHKGVLRVMIDHPGAIRTLPEDVVLASARVAESREDVVLYKLRGRVKPKVALDIIQTVENLPGSASGNHRGVAGFMRGSLFATASGFVTPVTGTDKPDLPEWVFEPVHSESLDTLFEFLKHWSAKYPLNASEYDRIIKFLSSFVELRSYEITLTLDEDAAVACAWDQAESNRTPGQWSHPFDHKHGVTLHVANVGFAFETIVNSFDFQGDPVSDWGQLNQLGHSLFDSAEGSKVLMVSENDKTGNYQAAINAFQRLVDNAHTPGDYQIIFGLLDASGFLRETSRHKAVDLVFEGLTELYVNTDDWLNTSTYVVLPRVLNDDRHMLYQIYLHHRILSEEDPTRIHRMQIMYITLKKHTLASEDQEVIFKGGHQALMDLIFNDDAVVPIEQRKVSRFLFQNTSFAEEFISKALAEERADLLPNLPWDLLGDPRVVESGLVKLSSILLPAVNNDAPKYVAGRITERFGDDPDAWQVVSDLADSWEGSLEELLDVAEATIS